MTEFWWEDILPSLGDANLDAYRRRSSLEECIYNAEISFWIEKVLLAEVLH